MDINFTRHSINTEETVFCESAEIQLESSSNPIRNRTPKKILKCSSHSEITSKSSSDRAVTVEGTTALYVIYLDADNCLSSYEHALPFSKSFEVDSGMPLGEITASVTEERFSASLTGDGAVSFSGTVCLNVCVKRKVDAQIICDIDNKDIEQLRGKAEVTMPMGRGEKNLIVEEEISIGNGQPSVECLIRHNATATIDETKIISGKVMVKGTVKVYVLYLPEEGTRPQNFEDSFPFSQLVDVEGINDTCKCDATVKILFCDLTPRVGNDDDVRSFSIAAKLAVSVKAYCDDEIPAVIDAYSTKGKCKTVRDEFVFRKIRDTVTERFIAKKDLEFTDGAIGSVIDMWCEPKNFTCKFENGSLKVTGTVLVNLLAYDCEGVPDCYERPVDFEYICPKEFQLSSPETACTLTVAHCSYTIIRANTVAVAIEPQLCATVYDNLKYALLTDITEEECSGDDDRRRSSIVLYFADAGETLWDIARRYNSSVSEIKALNSVTEDILTAPGKFIIPTK